MYWYMASCQNVRKTNNSSESIEDGEIADDDEVTVDDGMDQRTTLVNLWSSIFSVIGIRRFIRICLIIVFYISLLLFFVILSYPLNIHGGIGHLSLLPLSLLPLSSFHSM